jgi:ribonuclease-3
MPDLPHRFRDEALLALALTHASTGTERDNERLEFLGEAVLDLVVAEELFRCHPELAEGELTELKAGVVSRKTLAVAARQLGLDERARLGQGMHGRALPGSVLANLSEAVLGAVYLDAGLEAARAFSHETLADPLGRVREQEGLPNPKQELQRHAQIETGEPPSYVVNEERGVAHAKAFLVAAQVGERRYPSAWGRTRKEGERWAAHEALLAMDDARESSDAAG